MIQHNFVVPVVGAVRLDIVDRDDSVLPVVDICTAGPPCQSFLSAGKHEGVGDQRGVVFLR
eukprot:2474304-Lingulodinium_polyedra.AAC.1